METTHTYKGPNKNTRTGIKNSLDGLKAGSRRKRSELEDKSIKIIWFEEEKE